MLRIWALHSLFKVDIYIIKPYLFVTQCQDSASGPYGPLVSLLVSKGDYPESLGQGLTFCIPMDFSIKFDPVQRISLF